MYLFEGMSTGGNTQFLKFNELYTLTVENTSVQFVSLSCYSIKVLNYYLYTCFIID